MNLAVNSDTTMAPAKDGEGFSTHIIERNERGWPVANSDGFRIIDQPYGSKRKLRVIHIGGGASGICFSKFAEERLENVEVQIYEKNKDVGGTWLENRLVKTYLDSNLAEPLSDTPDVPATYLLHLTSSHGRAIRTGHNSIPSLRKYGSTSRRLQPTMT